MFLVDTRAGSLMTLQRWQLASLSSRRRDGHVELRAKSWALGAGIPAKGALF